MSAVVAHRPWSTALVRFAGLAAVAGAVALVMALAGAAQHGVAGPAAAFRLATLVFVALVACCAVAVIRATRVVVATPARAESP
ncbi:hypothetical protein Q6348_08795 [Isoptericola sp. b441]|uniref:Uncharacterized protein n=1 Tax=Actinotalea lenta TaxID=3064654 RepID=A0ABT9DAJ1_9CELL|nr:MULTISPECIES: hypothetical protein [unclassified Isoptericola]MDO8107289.1 hypothetical protein [Isoptericola sp. b441]MDO8121049.1 hypothetical protein [Isoptericola sp. b490]